MSDEIKKCEECGETEGRVINSDKFKRILCYRHYAQIQKHGAIQPDKPNEEKKCDECGETEGEIVNSKIYKKTLCNRHYKQMAKFGKINKYARYNKNEVIEVDDVSYIVLTNRKNEEVARAIVDTDDVNKIKQHKWSYSSKGYVCSTISGQYTLLHRMLLNYKGKLEIDHINRNKLDNRKENLRIVTHHENMLNVGMFKNNKSGVIGVYYKKLIHRWIMTISIDKKQLRKGFKTKEEAIKARLLAEKELYGNNAKQAHLFKEYNIA